MTGFRTAQNQGLALPYEGMDLQTPLPLLPPTRAPFIVNFTSEGQSLRVRYGTGIYSAISGASQFNFVLDLHTYTDSSGTQILFGFVQPGGGSAVTQGIYNFSSAAATLAQASAGSAGGAAFVQFRNYLYLIGATNNYVYDGSAWGAIGFTGPNFTNALDGTVYRNRAYFIVPTATNSFIIWYGGVNSVSGAMTELDLSSLFKKGGFLKAVLPISYSGSSSQSYLSFISSEGEVLVFSGAYPESPEWQVVAQFDIGKVIGIASGRFRKSYIEYQGDVFIPTITGLTSIKGMLQATNTATAYEALSSPIEKYWSRLASSNTVQTNGVISCYFSGSDSFYIAFNAILTRQNNTLTNEVVTNAQRTVFVYNLTTSSWTQYLYNNADPDIFSFAEFNSKLIVGTNRYGRVVEIEKVDTYRDEIIDAASAGTYRDIQAEILSSAFSSYASSGRVVKIGGLTLFMYLNTNLPDTSIDVQLIENFGKNGTSISNPRGLIQETYNNPFISLGSSAEYVQYKLNIDTNNSDGNPTTIYAINTLLETGGLR